MNCPHISKTILPAAAGDRGAYALKMKSTTLILGLLYVTNKRRLIWRLTIELNAALAPSDEGIGDEAIQSIRSVEEQALNLTT